MIQRTLSKTQKRVFVALSRQKDELGQAFQEVLEAEKEQIEMLRKHFDLPEGRYDLRQEDDGSVVIYQVLEEATEEEINEEEAD